MRRRAEGGAAVADFVLVSVLVLVLFVAVVQLGLALFTRNILISCASEGARYGARADAFPEGLLDVVSNDEHNVVESRADGVVDRVVEDIFTLRPNRVHLFESAVTASHTGRKNHKCLIHRGDTVADH